MNAPTRLAPPCPPGRRRSWRSCPSQGCGPQFQVPVRSAGPPGSKQSAAEVEIAAILASQGSVPERCAIRVLYRKSGSDRGRRGWLPIDLLVSRRVMIQVLPERGEVPTRILLYLKDRYGFDVVVITAERLAAIHERPALLRTLIADALTTQRELGADAYYEDIDVAATMTTRHRNAITRRDKAVRPGTLAAHGFGSGLTSQLLASRRAHDLTAVSATS